MDQVGDFSFDSSERIGPILADYVSISSFAESSSAAGGYQVTEQRMARMTRRWKAILRIRIIRVIRGLSSGRSMPYPDRNVPQ